MTQTKTGDAVRFMYDGVSRIVDNVDFLNDGRILVGFEMRRAGRFSYKIKKYSIDKISGLSVIASPTRTGPTLGRP
jgi:hypothetical protein